MSYYEGKLICVQWVKIVPVFIHSESIYGQGYQTYKIVLLKIIVIFLVHDII